MTAAWILAFVGVWTVIGWLFRVVDRIEGRR